MPSKELLLAQATFLGVDSTVYVRGTDVLRQDLKDQFLDHLKKQWKTKKSQESLEDYIRHRMASFPDTEEDLHLVKTNSKELRKKTKKLQDGKPKKRVEVIEDLDGDDEEEEEHVELDEEEVGSYEIQDGVKVYHQGGLVREPIHNLMQREGLTVGHIVETEEPPKKPQRDDFTADLVGDRPPRTLADLYARWPVEEDPQFYLRIERTKPKTYQGVNTSGFVGTLRGRRYSEMEIAKRFGGNEYKVTLYGPDPRGRADGNGNIKIKALTEPIVLTVPVYPPIIQSIEEDDEGKMVMNPMNPFGSVMSAPTTQGDAAIHKANASFFSDAMKLQREEFQRRDQNSAQMTSSVLSVMTKSQETQLQLLKEQSEQREKTLLETVKTLESRLEKAEAAKGTIAAEVGRAKDEANSQFLQYVEKLAPDKQAEIKRLQDYYNMQLDLMRRSHEDQLKNLRESHQATLDRILENNKQAVDRLESRVKDVETNYRMLLEQERSATTRTLDTERSQWAQRESQLREQMRDVTQAERSMAEKRIEDLKAQHIKEIQQMERAHDREIRSMKESSEVKLTVADQTHKMMLEHAEQRLQDAKEEVDRIREEMEEAKDIPAQLEKLERQAEILGYEKKDASEPKNALERFAATAGAGVSQLFASADQWLPVALARRAEAQQQQVQMMQAAQLQQQQRAQIQRQPAPVQSPVQRRRPVSQPQAPREPLGFQTQPPPAPQPTQEVMQPPMPPQQEQNSGIEQQQEIIQAEGMQMPEIPPKFLEHFQPEAMLQFLAQAENAVKTQVEAVGFADLMVNAYAEGAETLVGKFEPEEVLGLVSTLNEDSPLLRRDGRKWMASLWKSIRKSLTEKSKASSLSATP